MATLQIDIQSDHDKQFGLHLSQGKLENILRVVHSLELHQGLILFPKDLARIHVFRRHKGKIHPRHKVARVIF